MTEENLSLRPSQFGNRHSSFLSYPLCQPDPFKSCGACCGLYNWEDHSRRVLGSLLEGRTSLFHASGKDPQRFQESYLRQGLPPNAKLEAAIYNCEFLGFLDGERKRVGCLLHPSVNAGDDLRNHCCFYGLELCAGHFCPSYTHLTLSEQKTVLTSLSDWYLYGLVVTDVDLVKDFCHQAQTRLGDSLREERLRGERVLEALRDFFRLKESWKFTSRGKRLGKYYFTQSEYRIARIEYERNWKLKPSRYDRILLSLSSDFSTREEVLEAESMIEEKIEKFVRAYEKEG
jgi:hypothetical protein